MNEQAETFFRVTDLKQYIYCPRILYYHACLPDVRPTTYKMAAGVDAGEREKARAARRNLTAYDVLEGERHYDVPILSQALNLSGEVDEVVVVQAPEAEIIPVDYKLSKKAGKHFKLQLTAYAEMLAETWAQPVKRGFLLLIPLRRFEEVSITKRLHGELRRAVDDMARIAALETMPAPAKNRRKCAACEFRRFCNDV